MDKGLYLTFAIPDHPWIDASECAAVRIAMTVGASSLPPTESKLQRVTQETPHDETGENEVQLNLALGKLQADLTNGANVATTVPLKANDALASTGIILGSRGFVLSADQATSLRHADKRAKELIFPLRNGDDITALPRGNFVIDTHGWEEAELRSAVPNVFEHLRRTVYEDRKTNNDPKLRKLWWLPRRSNEQVRSSIRGLSRFLVTCETAKHRLFLFQENPVKPEHKLVVIGSEDAFHHGVLSSRIHTIYALAAGGWLGVGNDPVYAKSRCFDPFPFPDCTEKQKDRIRALAEELDAHRKRAQATHRLGLTDIYNVLEKLRAASSPGWAGPPGPPSDEPGRPGGPSLPLTAKERAIHDAALVSTLKQLHDELDAAVADAYGWPWPLTDAEILERVVALNAARATEEAMGLIRWLRPDYQKPLLAPAEQGRLALDGAGKKPKPDTGDTKSPARSSAAKLPAPRSKPAKLAWPTTLAERVKAVETALAAAAAPTTPAALAKRFTRAKPAEVAEILDTLAALGRARPGDEPGTYVA